MHELKLERFLPFARERVFEAWARAEHLAAWMGPSPQIRAEQVTVDFREGGHYRLGFTEPGEPLKVVEGTYLTIDPPRLLRFTWTWQLPQLGAGVETLVSVEFLESGQGTLLRLHHERFDATPARDLHQAGWRGTLDKLEAHCAGI